MLRHLFRRIPRIHTPITNRQVSTSIRLMCLPMETTDEKVLAFARGYGNVTELVVTDAPEFGTIPNYNTAYVSFDESASAIALMSEYEYERAPVHKLINDAEHSEERQQHPNQRIVVIFEHEYMKRKLSEETLRDRVFSQSRMKLLNKKNDILQNRTNAKYDLYCKMKEVDADEYKVLSEEIEKKYEGTLGEIERELEMLPTLEDWAKVTDSRRRHMRNGAR